MRNQILTAESLTNGLIETVSDLSRLSGFLLTFLHSNFSIDVKPKHGSPDFARDVAFQKIESRVKGTQMASEELGVV